MADKPVVLVTRKLPPNVEARLERDYRPLLNAEDRLYDTDALLRLADGADAILPCHTESLRADVIERLPQSVRIIATFSVGCFASCARDTVESSGELANASDRFQL